MQSVHGKKSKSRKSQKTGEKTGKSTVDFSIFGEISPYDGEKKYRDENSEKNRKKKIFF